MSEEEFFPDFGQPHYGVFLEMVGEDGEWLALDHIEPRQMVAAMLSKGRQHRLCRDEIIGDVWDSVDQVLSCVTHLRGVFSNEYANLPDGDAWYARWGDDFQTHRYARDITMWSA